MPLPVSKSVFAGIVEIALRDLPEQFAAALEEVRVEVRDWPTAGMLRRARLGPHDLLLGLYVGRPLTERSVEESGRMPDIIYVFQLPIEQISDTREQLIENIRSTVLHELGHHYGLDEDALDDLGYG
jgi:predicted Zn-dependent protease with MMP-like domain